MRELKKEVVANTQKIAMVEDDSFSTKVNLVKRVSETEKKVVKLTKKIEERNSSKGREGTELKSFRDAREMYKMKKIDSFKSIPKEGELESQSI